MGIFYTSLVASILLGVGGQIALKSGAVESLTVWDQFLNPRTMLGFGIYVVAAFLYIVALKRIPVSVAFPSVAVSYVVVAVLAHLLWNEPFGWSQIAGLVLIGGGIFLIHQH
ncbi:MAG TPA: EamA family transporter [Stellaceae bacterium]|jgi:undecaprenyl phosphate-alpha-L-ara4N flippase subunit ArnE